MNRTAKPIPSLALSVTIIGLYLFAAIPIMVGINYISILLSFPAEAVRATTSKTIIIVQVILTLAIVLLLLRKYSCFLLSIDWQKKFYKYSKIGLKWSIPILVFHSFAVLVPFLREKMIAKYLSMNLITVKGISNFWLIIFFIWLAAGAIFEELFFRGILLQKLQVFFSNNKCVLIAAILFSLSHFVFSPIKIGTLTSSFVIGLLSGFAFTSTNSCISAIFPHLLNNIICAGYVFAIR